jgi:hypothetical protein
LPQIAKIIARDHISSSFFEVLLSLLARNMGDTLAV